MPRRYTFPRTRRLRSRPEFQAVFGEGVKESRGPLTVFGRSNQLPYPRLGIRTPREVGTAVRRNRVRRLIREAFRLMQHDFPRGYDLVVLVKKHDPLILAEYQRLLTALLVRLHRRWEDKDTT